MGIYQRDITTYQQKSIIENDLTQHNCMNCHTFLNRKPQKMLFHMRADLGGTYLIDNGIPEKVKLGDDPHVKSLEMCIRDRLCTFEECSVRLYTSQEYSEVMGY